MKALVASLFVGTAVCVLGNPGGDHRMHDASAQTYEHLANVIIESRRTENSLVEGILMHYNALAQRHLAAAAESGSSEQSMHLQMAADEIANIANEGDKPVRAIRQRLLESGHHHHTDSETKEDYIYVDSTEKKKLLALAGRVGKLGASAQSDAIKSAMSDLDSLFESALKPE